jgi:methionyl-tRNA formyltransferase
MGTGPFAVPSFEALRNDGHQISVVVTRPLPTIKSRKGPPPEPVRDWADQYQLPIISPDSINSASSIKSIKDIHPDLLVVCDYGQILSSESLETSSFGGINLHGSLLPKYRGAAPVQRALLSGDTTTGVSVIHMTPRLDGGPILASASTTIGPTETSGQLEKRLSEIGIQPTLEAVAKLDNWDKVSSIGVPQDATQVTKAPRLSKKEAAINWNSTTRFVDCFVRGMQPWPIAFCHLPMPNNKPPLRIAIKKVSAIQRNEPTAEVHNGSEPELVPQDHHAPGTILSSERMIVSTRDGSLEIVTIQPAGKREMTGEEFMRGYQPPPGTVLQ